MPDSTIFQRGILPEHTADLIHALDKDYPPVIVRSPEDFATEAKRMELAVRIGKRQFVDTLKAMLTRTPESERTE